MIFPCLGHISSLQWCIAQSATTATTYVKPQETICSFIIVEDCNESVP